ncbi:class I SAM-dependent RNA methyltransferase [Gymnodinialimonas sp. 2305UL16-5]|uniref:class I SAM-dependent RNA methyltransferase n=1 Tax=Gymnodinialimonas mytili TaxID=3126503 RepID=UPI00309B0DED
MVECTIQRLGHHGDGIAEGPIYASLTLPGELIRGDRIGDRIADPRIVTPSSDRVTPPCPHYRACGGCSLMHASDPFVADWKTESVAKALTAHGIESEIRPIQTSSARTRRRATLSGTRTKKGALVGFHAHKSDTIVPIRDCFLLEDLLLRTLSALEQITRLGASRSATLSFAMTLTETGIDLRVDGGKPLDGPLRAALPQFAGTFARLSWADEPVFADGTPYLSIGPAKVSPPPGAFLQATADGEAALQTAVQEAMADSTRIADLFCGLGTFALPLAQNVPVHAVEGATDLIASLQEAVNHTPGLKLVTTETRDLFRRPLLPDELGKFDGLTIDPPRAGAEAQMHEIAKAPVPRIAMVSCNPVTFARDTAILIKGGYVLDWVQPVDQFRWSPHVELAAQLTLRHIGA